MGLDSFFKLPKFNLGNMTEIQKLLKLNLGNMGGEDSANFSTSSQANDKLPMGYLPDFLKNIIGFSNPAAGALGLLGTGAGLIGSFLTKEPNTNMNTSSYLNSGLTKQADNYTDLNSDYYRLGEEKIRRTMMDAAPNMNSLLGLAGATGGSAAQANLQRNAGTSKAMENSRVGMLDLFNKGQDLGLGYNKLNWEQAVGTRDAQIKQDWNIYNSKQQKFSNLGGYGGGMLEYGFGGYSG